MRKTIFVYTNDPKQKIVKLIVATDVHVLLGTKPSSINMGKQRKNNSYSKYVDFDGSDKDTVNIISVKSKNEFIQVETNTEGFENNPDKKIKITLLPGMGVGRFRDKITITTDHKTVSRLTVTVYGEIVGDINTYPKRLHYLHSEDKPLGEKIIILKSSSDTPFKILDVKPSHEDILTDVKVIQDGREYRVSVKFKDGFNRTYFRGNVIIVTDNKEQSSIQIGIMIRSAKFDRSRPEKKRVKKQFKDSTH